MPAKRLRELLEKNAVRYETIEHPLTYTAAETAAGAHVPGRTLAKTVAVAIDGRVVLVVVPSNCHVDLDSLREMTHARSVALVDEPELERLFPGCELGAMPPFGNLFGLDTYVAPELAETERIAFNAGTHTELMQVAYRDFDRLARPKVLVFPSPV